MVTFDLNTYKQCALLNITRQVKEVVQKSGVGNGLVMVHCPHTTAGITINENADPDVCADLLEALECMTPKLAYRHGEGNSPAHLKASLVGSSVTVPVHEGEMALGIWQGIYFCEFDGPRSRKFFVSIVK